MPSFRESLNSVYDRYTRESGTGRLVGPTVTARADSHGSQAVPMNSVQRIIRPLFGKSGIKTPTMGDHPDFHHLSGTSAHEYCAVTTLFMDMEGSTRLGLMYPLEDVYRIKNAFIRLAMEVVQSFDGHVHRIMGDAVMAYFGGKNERPEDSAVNAINCASFLSYLAQRMVCSWLESEGYGDQFGIRIGVDHGPKDKVLWSSYGYPNMDEVTATSFHVDVASKLQHAAGRNQIMLGDAIKCLLDLPSELLRDKTIQRGGEEKRVPFVKPNVSGPTGKPIDYRQYEFRWKNYLIRTPVGSKDQDFFRSTRELQLHTTVHDTRDTPAYTEYPACSSVLPKDKQLKFCVSLRHSPRLPYRVRFSVENHGEEALRECGPGLGNHETTRSVNTFEEHKSLVHWESTSYRGLHFLKVDIFEKRHPPYSASLGVFVE